MKTVFSRKELIHEAIRKIRYYRALYDVYGRIYCRNKASNLISDLYFLGVINGDKYDLLCRIYMKMFH